MTVIDEMHGSDEYADMEFVELLEFLVRYAYVSNDQTGSDPESGGRQSEPIHKKLKNLVEQMLALVDMQYIEPPEGGTATLTAKDFDKFRDRGSLREKPIEEEKKQLKIPK